MQDGGISSYTFLSCIHIILFRFVMLLGNGPKITVSAPPWYWLKLSLAENRERWTTESCRSTSVKSIIYDECFSEADGRPRLTPFSWKQDSWPQVMLTQKLYLRSITLISIGKWYTIVIPKFICTFITCYLYNHSSNVYVSIANGNLDKRINILKKLNRGNLFSICFSYRVS